MHSLGIDLGGTFARAAVVERNGKLLTSAKVTLADRSPTGVIEAIAHATNAALSQAPGVAVERCGVGVAGQLGPKGSVANAPNLGWRDVPFGELLATRLSRTVKVANDLAAAAWGEFRAGAARGVSDVFVVFVGSGVGSRVIANRILVSGATGVAGEFGHIKVVPNGRLCGCGERGCLEAYVGGHSLIAQMRELVSAHPDSVLTQLSEGDPARLNPAMLEEAARLQDPHALALYTHASTQLGLAVANMVTVLNPAMLLLGGGVLTHAPGIKAAVSQCVSEYTLLVSRRVVRIADAALGDDSGLIGAALLAFEGEAA